MSSAIYGEVAIGSVAGVCELAAIEKALSFGGTVTVVSGSIVLPVGLSCLGPLGCVAAEIRMEKLIKCENE